MFLLCNKNCTEYLHCTFHCYIYYLYLYNIMFIDYNYTCTFDTKSFKSLHFFFIHFKYMHFNDLITMMQKQNKNVKITGSSVVYKKPNFSNLVYLFIVIQLIWRINWLVTHFVYFRSRSKNMFNIREAKRQHRAIAMVECQTRNVTSNFQLHEANTYNRKLTVFLKSNINYQFFFFFCTRFKI